MNRSLILFATLFLISTGASAMSIFKCIRSVSSVANLSQRGAQELCETAESFESGLVCATAAPTIGFSNYGTYVLCTNGGNQARIDCAKDGFDQNFKADFIISVCNENARQSYQMADKYDWRK